MESLLDVLWPDDNRRQILVGWYVMFLPPIIFALFILFVEGAKELYGRCKRHARATKTALHSTIQGEL